MPTRDGRPRGRRPSGDRTRAGPGPIAAACWRRPLVLALRANAQGRYPSRPIQLLVPWAAGGGTDAVARMIGALLERDLGQPIVVVNRTGGSGVVGHAAIAMRRPMAIPSAC